MEGITCPMCGGQIKITIHGGEFLVRPGSTLTNMNFEKVSKVDIMRAQQLNEDVMLQVHIECATDSTHSLFAHASTSIRKEIYRRIECGARRLYIQNM